MVLVVDASVVAEFLVRSQIGDRAARQMDAHAGELHMPHLAAIETVSVLRAWVRRLEVVAERASAALDDLADLPVRRWPAEPFLARIWELRNNVTAYDATYVALAESLDADLVTTDRRLVRGIEGLTDCRVVTLDPAR